MFLTKYSESMMFLRKHCLWCVVWLLCITVACIGVGCGNGGDVVTPTESEVVDVTETVEISDPTVEPDGPSPEEQLAGIYELIRYDATNQVWRGEGWDDFFGEMPPFTPPKATGSLNLFEEGSFHFKWRLETEKNRMEGGYSSDKWEASATKISLLGEHPDAEVGLTYAWQGTDLKTLVMEIKTSPSLLIWDPNAYTIVWKRTE